jgi:hypothetical protein
MKEQKAAEAVTKEHEEQETKGVKAEEQKSKVPSPMGWGLGRPSVRNLKTLIPKPTPAPLPCANSNPGTDQNLKAIRAPTSRSLNPTHNPARPEPEASPLSRIRHPHRGPSPSSSSTPQIILAEAV